MKKLFASLFVLLIFSSISYADEELLFLDKEEDISFYLINSSIVDSMNYKQASMFINNDDANFLIVTHLYDCKNTRFKLLHTYLPGNYDDLSNRNDWKAITIADLPAVRRAFNIVCIK